jgi:hypothetical protein
MNKAAAKSNNDSTSLDTNKSTKIKPITQKEKVLTYFVRAGNYGYYQIEAYKVFQVTCLHSYISNLEKQGLKFNRKLIQHINSAGGKTHFMRYWIANEQAHQRAVKMIKLSRSQRGAATLLDLPPYSNNKTQETAA